MPTRVVTSGFSSIPGKTMFEKKGYVEKHLAIETGLVKMTEPITQVTLDTLADLASAEARVKNGRVKSVKIRNFPYFLYRKDNYIVRS